MASNEEPVTTLDDIRRLQALLKQIQSDAVPSRSGAGSGVHCRRHRLTEQNVVDIVAEMLRLGVYMDDNLIIDLYGKEYITGSHLEKELVDEVRKQQGLFRVYCNLRRIEYLELKRGFHYRPCQFNRSTKYAQC